MFQEFCSNPQIYDDEILSSERYKKLLTASVSGIILSGSFEISGNKARNKMYIFNSWYI